MSATSIVRRWAPIAAPLAALAAYAPTLGAPFVWDDRHLILDSSAVRTLQPIASYFGRAFWTSPEAGDVRGYYRPLTVLSFALQYHLHGPNPAPFHLANVVLHALNALLLYLLLRRFRVSPAVALTLDLLWALAPRLTEPVAWISGRTDVLATTFVLAALLVHRPARIGRMLGASGLVLAGLFAKEIAVAGVAALVALELSSRPPRRPRLALAPLGAFAVYYALRALALHGAPPLTPTHLGALHRVGLVLATLGTYAGMLVWPWRPELQIGDASLPAPAMIAGGAVALVALGALGYRARGLWWLRRTNVRPLVVGGSALALVGIGLVVHVAPIAVNVVAADRFLYLPLAGLALAFAPVAQTLTRRWRWLLGLSGLLVVSFFAVMQMRLGDWSSEVRLWGKTYAEASRHDCVPANELGNVYYRAGMFAEAAAIYGSADPHGVGADELRGNRAAALSQLGDYEGASRELSALCLQRRDVAQYCVDAGLVELHRLRFEAARAWVAEAIARAGRYPTAVAALDAIARTEARVRAPEYASPSPLVRLEARFEVAELAGQRPDALRLGEELLERHDAPRDVRREAAEYWARFGPPERLRAVLGAPAAMDVVDERLRSVVDLRAQTAAELRAAWPALHLRSASGRPT